MQKWLIRKLGGYASLDEAFTHAPKQVLNQAVADLYCYATDDDIIRIKTNTEWWHKGRTLTESEIQQIKAEAALIQSTFVWKVLQAEMKYIASKKLYHESQTVEDITWAKLLIFTADLLKTKLNKLAK